VRAIATPPPALLARIRPLSLIECSMGPRLLTTMSRSRSAAGCDEPLLGALLRRGAWVVTVSPLTRRLRRSWEEGLFKSSALRLMKEK
jgi:hypothetical protein